MTNHFRGIPLPPAGQRQSLKGLMRQIKQQKREEAEARNAVTPDQRRASWLRANPDKPRSPRKARRDERRRQAALADQAFPGTDETTEGIRDWHPNG